MPGTGNQDGAYMPEHGKFVISDKDCRRKPDSMAERKGFEPLIRCRIHTFQACAFNRSATSPDFDPRLMEIIKSRAREG